MSALFLIDYILAMRDFVTVQQKFVLMFCYARHIACSHYIYAYTYIRLVVVEKL